MPVADRTIRNLQALRAVAAFMVVLYHARLLTPVGQRVSFDFGNAGVDIFFLISGFIIAHVTRGDAPESGFVFLLKRAIRVIPLYWLLTLALFAAAQVAPQLAGSGGKPGVVELAKSLLFVPYVDASGERHPILFMGWTLNYEIFFYLLGGAALMLRREIARIAAISAVLGALVLAGFVLRPEGAILATYTDLLMIEFAIGMWLNLAFRRTPMRASGRGYRLASMALCIAGMALLIAGDYFWPGLVREVKWGVPAMMIVGGALALEHGGATARSRALMLMGEASYAVYLTHAFVIKAVSIALGLAGLATMSWGPSVLILLGVYALVAAVGIAVHLAIEKPLTQGLRARALRDRPAPASRARTEAPGS